MKRVFFGLLFTLTILGSFFARSAKAEFTTCAQLGLQNGGSSGGLCGIETGCIYSTAGSAAAPHLCCRPSDNSRDRCYNKLSGQFADPNYLQITPQPADATATGAVQDLLNTKTKKPIEIRFKPQITLPGSKFIAGDTIKITGNTLGEYIAALYAFGVTAIGILATVMVAFGGMQWLLAAGDRGKVQSAKETISSAIIGLILALTAYMLLLIVSPKLVKFNSLSLVPVKGIEQGASSSTEEVAAGARGATPSTATLSRNWLDATPTGVRTQYGALISSLLSPQVPEDMIYAIIYVESGGRPEVVSSAGACGIMQLLPATAQKTCEQLKNAQVGIEAGVAYLKQLASNTCPDTARRRNNTVAQCKPPAVQSTNCTNGNLNYVAAAYNGGVGANCGSRDCPGRTWWECQANPGYQETRDYVVKVQAARTKLQCLLTTSGDCI